MSLKDLTKSPREVGETYGDWDRLSIGTKGLVRWLPKLAPEVTGVVALDVKTISCVVLTSCRKAVFMKLSVVSSVVTGLSTVSTTVGVFSLIVVTGGIGDVSSPPGTRCPSSSSFQVAAPVRVLTMLFINAVYICS